MTSPLFGSEEEWMHEVVGAYPAVAPKEPDMTRMIRIAESRKAGLRLWEAVQKELTRAR